MEIRWHGRGGQGIVTAAKLLAEVSIYGGKHAQALPDYGAERMGAPIRAYTRISDKPIRAYCQITSPDIVVVVDPTLIDAVPVDEGLKKDGIILVNINLPPEELKERMGWNARVHTVDATSIALSCIGRNFPNIPLLGAFVKITGVVKLEEVEEKMREKFGGRVRLEEMEGNVRALRRGYEEVR